ncbi:307_t:CDS:1 [Acaulospora morrowiae]|uniref:307_t:CDS:1 n=1 Tax=Acaulospora morrowiae TaxID=94023 RepID=A0A9N8VBN9_9GLOM|nr:307_t:CDS:1 [Acaulospora morrowiae]
MSNKSQLHYYEDGDILVVVQDTIFRLHKNILSLSSKVFADMFSCVNQSSTTHSDSDKPIPSVSLTDSSASKFSDLVSFLYPQKFFPVTWSNVSEFLVLADKYEIESVFDASKNFLEEKFQENPSLTFVLADKFRFPELYKESSKLIFDIFPAFQATSLFRELTPATSLALMNRYFSYVTAIGSLKDFEERLIYESDRQGHIRLVRQGFLDNLANVQVHPILPPSEFYRKLYTGSAKNFIEQHLPKEFIIHCGTFESLKHKDKNGDHYLFIEMDI